MVPSAKGDSMTGNNPNQNTDLGQNKAKPPVKGFPGMKDAGNGEKKKRSSQEVREARENNAENEGEEPKERPF
jgi:hypothetical protein